MQYLVPRSLEAALPSFLSQLETSKVELGVTDVNIRLASLEEVFLTIARQAEREAAEEAGNVTQKFPLPDGTILEVRHCNIVSRLSQASTLYSIRHFFARLGAKA